MSVYDITVLQADFFGKNEFWCLMFFLSWLVLSMSFLKISFLVGIRVL